MSEWKRCVVLHKADGRTYMLFCLRWCQSTHGTHVALNFNDSLPFLFSMASCSTLWLDVGAKGQQHSSSMSCHCNVLRLMYGGIVFLFLSMFPPSLLISLRKGVGNLFASIHRADEHQKRPTGYHQA
jgi:hypothetical protein